MTNIFLTYTEMDAQRWRRINKTPNKYLKTTLLSVQFSGSEYSLHAQMKKEVYVMMSEML